MTAACIRMVNARVVALLLALTCFSTPAAAQIVIWEPVRGLAASDIAIAADGTAWAVSSNQTKTIHRMSPGETSWTTVDGLALRIAVEGQTAWIVTENGTIQRRVREGDRERWVTMPGPRGVDIGANAKGVWLVGDPGMTGGNYSIYRWNGKLPPEKLLWDKLDGAAVRIDVDSAGNPWVLDAAGRLYAFFNNQWQQFATPDAAASNTTSSGPNVTVAKMDLSVHTFGEPWIVTPTGTLLRFNAQSRQWDNAGASALTLAARGEHLWQIASSHEVQRRHRPGFVAQADTRLEITSTTSSTFQITPSAPSRSPTTGPDLTVGGQIECLQNPKLPHCQQPAVTSTAAARGAAVFPEPGLSVFLVNGALPLLEHFYQYPAVITGVVKANPNNTTTQQLANAIRDICVNPVENPVIKGLMYDALIKAVETPPGKRSHAQQYFVTAFTDYMWTRRLFIAERAQWLYNDWRAKIGAQGVIARQQEFMMVPPDFLDEVRSAIVLGSTGVAVVASIGAVYAFGVAQTSVAGGLAVSGTVYGLMTGGLSATALSTGALASLAAAPAAVALAGAAIITIAVVQTAKAAEYEKAIATAVAAARKRPDLAALIKTKEGLGEMAHYWSLAVSVPGPIVFQLDGNRTAGCQQTASLERVPEAVRAGRFQLLTTVSYIHPTSKRTVAFNPHDALAASHVTSVGSLDARASLGEAAWRANIVSAMGCYEPIVIARFQETGQPGNCAPGAAHVAWIYAPPYIIKHKKLPPDSVIAGTAHAIAMAVCRADMGDGWHPGKVWGQYCNVGWGGQERREPVFDVLTASRNAVQWVPVSRGQPLPERLVEADTHSSGRWLYVCRAQMNDGVHPGKVWGSRCLIGWGGKEIAKDDYEVLQRLVPWGPQGGPRVSYKPR